ncbi:hypothetical protein HYPSUDRAFT_200309 [Hypholoma sublateritium FD-334 SS-4]|uniref:Uncharacterized protein n=1 Tax=Hypholoma sublateritium (strain FD-334 SS-4) TaxID=945553 RepID=A0A0D2MLN5_HYPSF|nr:hypothetical protein HYPSUDRAFT_200309 [Hypholoma sublateritium FD-334 SS-4]
MHRYDTPPQVYVYVYHIPGVNRGLAAGIKTSQAQALSVPGSLRSPTPSPTPVRARLKPTEPQLSQISACARSAAQRRAPKLPIDLDGDAPPLRDRGRAFKSERGLELRSDNSFTLSHRAHRTARRLLFTRGTRIGDTMDPNPAHQHPSTRTVQLNAPQRAPPPSHADQSPRAAKYPPSHTSLHSPSHTRPAGVVHRLHHAAVHMRAAFDLWGLIGWMSSQTVESAAWKSR